MVRNRDLIVILTKLKKLGFGYLPDVVYRDLMGRCNKDSLSEEGKKRIRSWECLLDIPANLVPTCPRCRIPMEIKYSQQNIQHFWGCPNYYKQDVIDTHQCKETRPVNFIQIRKFARKNQADLDDAVEEKKHKRRRYSRFAHLFQNRKPK